MKRFVFAGALALAAGGQALAADLPPPMAPPPRAPATYVPAPVPIFTWSGIYIGINGGYGFGTATASGGGGSISPNGFLVGGTLGGNYQFGNFVVGLEGDGDWSNLDGTNTTGWLRSQKHVAGHRPRPRRLCLGPRVVLWHRRRRLRQLAGGPTGGPFTSGSQAGWTAGAGVEAAFAPNWTAKVEYLYVDFAGLTCTTCGGGAPSVTLTENLVRAGINYKFSW